MPTLVKDIEKGQSFQEAVRHLRDLTQNDLARVNEVILNHMDSSVALIPELAGHLINAGGKRLRPIMTLAASGAFGYQGDDHIYLAAAVELIHGATLLHDDVVDDSALRRGLETANIVWGNKESILVGDFLFSRAFVLMVKTNSLKVLDILSNASCIIAEGEVLQLATQNNVETDYDAYIEVVKAKTAALFAAATRSGAVVAGASEEQEQAFYDYGLNLGIAYQLIDDALDYTGDERTLGKSVGDDFREGKMTLPVVYAFSMARNEDEKKFWRRALGKGEQKSGDFETALTLIKRDDTVSRTIQCAEEFSYKALKALEKLPKNNHTDALADLAALSVSRMT